MLLISGLRASCIWRCSEELYLLTVVFQSDPWPMLWYPSQIHISFQCSAARGIKGAQHSVLVFNLAPYVQRLLQTLWISWWYFRAVNDKIPQIPCNCMLRNVLTCWAIFPLSFSQPFPIPASLFEICCWHRVAFLFCSLLKGWVKLFNRYKLKETCFLFRKK